MDIRKTKAPPTSEVGIVWMLHTKVKEYRRAREEGGKYWLPFRKGKAETGEKDQIFQFLLSEVEMKEKDGSRGQLKLQFRGKKV